MNEGLLRFSAGTVPPGRWAVGVSGGADSVALLLLLHLHRPADLHIVHLDHETREGASAQDAAFVTGIAARLNLPVSIATRSSIEADDPAPLSNLSSRFRKARFELFRRTVAAHSLQGVILAHHADDQAETVLQRLLRGAGPGAIVGMKSRSIVDGLLVLRPLLQTPSESLREFLRVHHQQWREDASNQSDKYQRNRLRRWLADRPAFRETLLHLGDQSANLRDWLNQTSPQLADRFRTEDLSGLPTPVARHAVTEWLIARGSSPDEINRQVCDRLIDMATDAATPARRHFPGQILVRRHRGEIFVDPR